MAEALFLDLSTNQNRWSVLRPPLINPMPTVKYNQYFSVTYFISNQWSCKTFHISKILPITNAISIPPQNTRNVRSSSICGLVFPVFWSKNGNYKISNSFYRCLSRFINHWWFIRQVKIAGRGNIWGMWRRGTRYSKWHRSFCGF